MSHNRLFLSVALALSAVFLSCGQSRGPADPISGGADAGSAGAGGTDAGTAGAADGGGAGGSYAGAAGSGGEAGAPEPRSICDGSDGIRFAASDDPRGNFGAGLYVVGLLWELGFRYLFVSGRCEYVAWASDPELTQENTWAPVRKGVLDEATASELAEAFSYSRWPELEGFHVPGPGEPSAIGASRVVLYDGEHHVVCQTPCRMSAPEIADAVVVGLNSWIERLHEEGEDLDGPVRLRVFEFGGNTNIPETTWPLSRPITELVTPEDPLCMGGGGISCPTYIFGPAHRIDDPDDLAALRALRPELAGRPAYASEAAVSPHEDPNKEYRWAFRDVLPFENEEGEVPGLYEY